MKQQAAPPDGAFVKKKPNHTSYPYSKDVEEFVTPGTTQKQIDRMPLSRKVRRINRI